MKDGGFGFFYGLLEIFEVLLQGFGQWVGVFGGGAGVLSAVYEPAEGVKDCGAVFSSCGIHSALLGSISRYAAWREGVALGVDGSKFAVVGAGIVEG